MTIEPCEARGVCKASGQLVFCSLAEGHEGDHYGVDATAKTEYHQTWPRSRHDVFEQFKASGSYGSAAL